MRVVIIDDEYYAMQGLKMELEDIEGVEVVGTFEEGVKAISAVHALKPDLLFLDIEMPRLNGFDLFERIVSDTGWCPHVVFVTAYSHYAVKAFEVNAIDYILKPVTRHRLVKSLERFKEKSKPVDVTSLKIQCFKHFAIFANGKDINSGWRTRKAEELIAYLVCENGDYVSKEKIAEALWPEQSRENALSNLYMAYYYLKKQEDKTGVKIPVESERGKMRVDMTHMACDLAEFCKCFDEGKKADEESRVKWYERAVDLYKGLAFEGNYYGWVGTVQNYYEYRWMEALEYLIDYHERNGNHQTKLYYEEKRF